MILVLLPFCFCQLPVHSILLRLDVAVIIDLTLLLIDGFIRCPLEYRVRLVYDLSAK